MKLKFSHRHDVSKPPVAGRRGMTEYRAYTVGYDGHFIGFKPLVCMDDAEAMERTRQLIDGHAVELWSGVRFVARLEPKIKLT
jgi:hypothetical protein